MNATLELRVVLVSQELMLQFVRVTFIINAIVSVGHLMLLIVCVMWMVAYVHVEPELEEVFVNVTIGVLNVNV